jgi:hypothetical protein
LAVTAQANTLPGPPASIGGTASSNGSTVTVSVGCPSTPCTITIKIVAPSTAGRAMAASNKPVTIATGRVSLRHPGKKQVAVRLTKAGKKLLKKHHGRLTAKVLASAKIGGQLRKSSRTIHIKTTGHRAR